MMSVEEKCALGLGYFYACSWKQQVTAWGLNRNQLFLCETFWLYWFYLLWCSQNKLCSPKPYLNLPRLLARSSWKGPNGLPLLLPEHSKLSSRIAAQPLSWDQGLLAWDQCTRVSLCIYLRGMENWEERMCLPFPT